MLNWWHRLRGKPSPPTEVERTRLVLPARLTVEVVHRFEGTVRVEMVGGVKVEVTGGVDVRGADGAAGRLAPVAPDAFRPFIPAGRSLDPAADIGLDALGRKLAGQEGIPGLGREG